MSVVTTPNAIEVNDLSTSYRLHVNGTSAWAGFFDLLKRGQSTDRLVPAVRDVTFNVPQGTVLCVIGRNGAGKSTLLRCLAGILAPDQGSVVVNGRISAMLTIGVGMNGKLTGRENIRLGGLAMGLDERRLDDLADTIADFAQLGEYVDFPIDTYSSGMRARLGFAVTAHLDPEVLLIDEALSGGDTRFQNQTADKMFELCSNDRTIVLVTHSLMAVRHMATSVLWMHQGRVVEFGDPDVVAASYMRYCRLTAADVEFDQY